MSRRQNATLIVLLLAGSVLIALPMEDVGTGTAGAVMQVAGAALVAACLVLALRYAAGRRDANGQPSAWWGPRPRSARDWTATALTVLVVLAGLLAGWAQLLRG